ncbi:MAG: YhcH/YjgK/YiaL family protein [Elusimicrobiota bacterium]|jgi:YhcH/YjgK/YiaL family protein|nr:YhcH/YjgK/YiaL family protein [Elusimicrobiota bacterium]
MITGNLSNIDFYSNLFPKAKKGFDFLKTASISTENKTHEISDGLRVMVFESAPKETPKLETHDKYIDIQFVIEGEDAIGFKPAADCKEIDIPYNAEKDITFFKGVSDYIIPVRKGEFIAIFPDEAHAPAAGGSKNKKAVVKVRLDLLK